MHKDAKPPYDDALAALQLHKLTEVPSFAKGALQTVCVPFADVFLEPEVADNAPETQLLFGEPFVVYERDDEWLWGQSLIDDFVGYVRASDLRTADEYATHRVSHIRTYVYPDPSLLCAPEALLSLNSRLTIVEQYDDKFSRLSSGSYVPNAHILPVTAAPNLSPADFAERFLQTPYLRGGRTSIGLDPAALIQLCVTACNFICPREADLQEAVLGIDVPLAELQRNDLVYWRNHVGIMADSNHIIHADPEAMQVVKETLSAVDMRQPTALRSVRRLA
jgi:cell wall-associated NlpC family hydrolase